MSILRGVWARGFVSGWSSPDIIWYIWSIHTWFAVCIAMSANVAQTLPFIGLQYLDHLGVGRWGLFAILMGCSQVALVGLLWEKHMSSRAAFLCLWPQYFLTLLALFTEIEVLITNFTNGYRGTSGNVVDPWVVSALLCILLSAGILHTRAMLKRYVVG